MNYRNSFTLFVLAAINIFTANAQELLKTIWESCSLPLYESVLHCAAKNRLYVSLIEGAGNIRDGKGALAILNADGNIENAKWMKKLNSPVYMT